MIHADMAVWIDQREARVFALSHDHAEAGLRPLPGQNVVREAVQPEFGGSPLEFAFLERVRQALADASAILIAGPGSAKAELVAHIRQHDPAMGRRILGVEPLDLPGEDRLAMLARRAFGNSRRPPTSLESTD